MTRKQRVAYLARLERERENIRSMILKGDEAGTVFTGDAIARACDYLTVAIDGVRKAIDEYAANPRSR